MEYVDDTRESDLWTSKYAPRTADQIEGSNELITAVNYIGKWLSNFEKNRSKALNGSKNKKRKRKIKIELVDDIEVEVDGKVAEDEGVDEGVDVVDVEVDTQPDAHYSSTKINQNGDCSSLVVIGSHGVGKTCCINAILKTLKYDKQTINFSKIKKSTDIKDALGAIVNASNILQTLEGGTQRKSVLVIDEIESVSSGSGRTCIETLLRNNIDNWTCPIIFISDGQHSRLLTGMKKNCNVVKIPQPDRTSMLKLIKTIARNEKILIAGWGKNDFTVIDKLVEHAQKDYRRLILTLYDLKYAFGSKQQITDAMFDDYLKLSKKKDEDFDLFRATNTLLQKYSGIEDCIRMYETDKVVLPLMVQQNYLQCITSKTNDKDLQYETAKTISRHLSDGDIVENYIYGDQNWDIIEVHGFYTCVAPSYTLSKSFPKDRYLNLSFPADLNKMSISRINKRNIINANKAFKSKNLNDYIYINMIIRYLTSENRIKECIDLMKDYGISINSIESLMKIDKIKVSKTNLTTKQKKEMTMYLDE